MCICKIGKNNFLIGYLSVLYTKGYFLSEYFDFETEKRYDLGDNDFSGLILVDLCFRIKLLVFNKNKQL